MERPPAAADVLELVEKSLGDDKAQGIVVVDLAGKTDIADFLVIASGTSPRQIGAITEHLRKKLKASGLTGISVEGAAHCDWVLIDAGDVVVHLFRPEVRAFYSLEKMWGVPGAGEASGTVAGITA